MRNCNHLFERKLSDLHSSNIDCEIIHNYFNSHVKRNYQLKKNHTLKFVKFPPDALTLIIIRASQHSFRDYLLSTKEFLGRRSTFIARFTLRIDWIGLCCWWSFMTLFHRQAFCTIYWPNRCILSSQFSLVFVSLVLFASEKHFFPNYLYCGIPLRRVTQCHVFKQWEQKLSYSKVKGHFTNLILSSFMLCY